MKKETFLKKYCLDEGDYFWFKVGGPNGEFSDVTLRGADATPAKAEAHAKKLLKDKNNEYVQIYKNSSPFKKLYGNGRSSYSLKIEWKYGSPTIDKITLPKSAAKMSDLELKSVIERYHNYRPDLFKSVALINSKGKIEKIKRF